MLLILFALLQQEVEIDGTGKVFAAVGIRLAPSVVGLLIGHVDRELDDAEWIINRLKAESAEITPQTSSRN